MNILVCMRQKGGADAVVPVAKLLHGLGDNVCFYSQGVAYLGLQSSLPLVPADSILPKDLLNWVKPDVVVTECVAPEENAVIPRQITDAAVKASLPVVMVQDFWASGLSVAWESLPSLVCVQDEFAKKLIHQAWPEMSDKRVIVTGQPAFDILEEVDCQRARYDLKAMYGLPKNWPIIHYSGGFKGTAESVSALVEALNMLEIPVYLFIRLHPRMTDPNASDEWKEEGRKYQDLNPRLKYGKSIDTSDRNISDLINAASDVVVGAFPTMIVKACHLGIPCLSITNPSAQEYFEMETAGTLKEFPPVSMDCCHAATNAKEAAGALRKIFDCDTKIKQQTRHFATDGKSAVRVACVVSNAPSLVHFNKIF